MLENDQLKNNPENSLSHEGNNKFAMFVIIVILCFSNVLTIGTFTVALYYYWKWFISELFYFPLLTLKQCLGLLFLLQLLNLILKNNLKQVFKKDVTTNSEVEISVRNKFEIPSSERILIEIVDQIGKTAHVALYLFFGWILSYAMSFLIV